MADDEACQSEMLTWFEHERCPFAEECATTTFKKWRCWGPDMGTADDRLADHLWRCGLHAKRAKQDPDSITLALSGAIPTCKTETHTPKKRRRRGGAGRKRRGNDDDGGDGEAQDDGDEEGEPKTLAAMNQDELRTIVDEMMMERLGLHAGPNPRSAVPSTASSSAAPSHTLPLVRQARAKPRVFNISEQEYRSLYERMNRVAAAARGAQRFRGAEVLLFIYLVS